MSTWVSPSLSRFNRGTPSTTSSHDDISSAGPSAFAPQYEAVQLGSSSVLKPLTPPNVSNLTPATCLAIGEFKELLRQYRQLDDGITTRLNRSFARSRALGQSTSPSLLSSSGMTSASSADLGTSTYATPAPGACAAFWRQLVDVWIGREEAVRFCIKVVDQHSNPPPPPTSSAPPSSADQLLDADYHPSSPSPKREQRWSRAENSAETLARQLHNELKVESIIRARSLDAFKSRCKFFTPSPPAGPEGDRERAMWLGQPTPAAQASAQGAIRP
ncbi:hypothetical protein EX895_001714 [Sporisorium graminicola]|uniref:Caffeine-induced death protein Cid2 n=1 Tax=Sporisorium graminicola TaxID=280036 RepID=A0A4U7KWZ8_9BASI|nr:hypothetical protein EX895_001714 [Sporisorium graminicola]TKY89183.1 hypothetical protein EX895_001714 [Sporisorium graminicola]